MHRLSRVARSAGVLALGVAFFGGLAWVFMTPPDVPPPPPPPPPAPSVPAPPAVDRVAGVVGCRVTAADGDVRLHRSPPATARLHDPDAGPRDGGLVVAADAGDATPSEGLEAGWVLEPWAWVTVAPAESFSIPGYVVRWGGTDLQLSFSRKSLARPCASTNEAWVARGHVATEGTDDAGPSAATWIVTPLAFILSQRARTEASAVLNEIGTLVEVESALGVTRVLVADDASTVAIGERRGDAGALVPRKDVPAGFEEVGVGTLLFAKGPPIDARSIAAAITSCEKAARDTATDASALTKTRGSEGSLVARTSDAIARARARCAIARVRVALAAPAERPPSSLLQRLEKASDSLDPRSTKGLP